MSVLINEMLQSKCLVYGAVPWPVPSLSRRPQAMLFCVPNQALDKETGIEPAKGLTHSDEPVNVCTCGITSCVDRSH